MPDTNPQPSRSELLEHARGTFLFADLSEEIREELSHGLSWVTLQAGEVLFRQGEASDSAYVLITGRLKVAILEADGDELFVTQIEPGQSVGELGVFTGHARTATIYADSDGPAELVAVPASGFNHIASTNPYALAQVSETIRQCLFRDQLAAMLPALFGDLDEQTFTDIEAVAERVDVSRGDIIFREDEPGDGLYILIGGRLQAWTTQDDETRAFLGEIFPGECVGEMSMFTGETCTADVIAVRDTMMVKFSKEAFQGLMRKYPLALEEITKVVIGRLRRLVQTRTPPQTLINVAVIPINREVPLEEFTARLVTGLQKIDSAIHLSSQRVDELLCVDRIAQADRGNPLNIKIAAWLDEQESANRFVIYQGDAELTEWTRRAIRQADRILLVGQAGDDPAMAPLEFEVQKASSVRKDLILLHPDATKRPQGTIKWLNARDVTQHHHVRWNLDGDFERVARFLAGKAVGLCLGGGGARGFAHFGVIRTMQEEGVPIDVIGGNSMGAYVASVYATGDEKGWSVSEMIQATRTIFARWYLHLTPPITSMVSDGLLVHDIKACLGNVQIEDLWLPYFCVSSNLTRAEVRTHSTGDLWRAVRVSGGLPGIVPPLVFDGDLHVDGALLDNLPVSIMDQMCDSGIVIAVDVSPIVDMAENKPYGDSLSGFDIMFSKVNPFTRKIKVPNILTIMQRSTEVGAVLQLKGIVKKLSDIYLPMPVEPFPILGFNQAETIVRVGYDEAQKRLVPWLNEKVKK